MRLTWVAGKNGADRRFLEDKENPKVDIVGYFNLIHSTQVQIIGRTEMDYLESISETNYKIALDRLFPSETIIIIIANNLQPPAEIRTRADRNDIALFVSHMAGERLINDLRYYLSRLLAKKITLHGVFMEVISVGALLTGSSGVGKSELALELITRGHRLIADDAPSFARIAPDIIVGTAPPVIQDFLEVRGLGVLNIREMYGDSAIKNSKYLKMIIDLQPLHKKDGNKNRLVSEEKSNSVLGLDIPLFTLPVAPGRNLAVLVEAAVRNHLLRLGDHYADREIMDRQQKMMQEG